MPIESELSRSARDIIPVVSRESTLKLVNPSFPLEFTQQNLREVAVHMITPVNHAKYGTELFFTIQSDPWAPVSVTPFQFEDLYGERAPHATGGLLISFDTIGRLVILGGEKAFYSGLMQDHYAGVLPNARILKLDPDDREIRVQPEVAPYPYVLQNNHGGLNPHWGLHLYNRENHVFMTYHRERILITRERNKQK